MKKRPQAGEIIGLRSLLRMHGMKKDCILNGYIIKYTKEYGIFSGTEDADSAPKMICPQDAQ